MITVARRLSVLLRDARDHRRLRDVIAARRLLEDRGYVVRLAASEAMVDAISAREVENLRQLLAAARRRIADLEQRIEAMGAGAGGGEGRVA